jgi:tRNA(His) 5'-end guanylyltransferase
MKKTFSLAFRMKEYESVTRYHLTRRMPVIIRLDGCAFHTFTDGFNKPFDTIFRTTMLDTMQYLCSHIDGVVLGYTQSDEITLVLCDYKGLDTQAWFDNTVQKMCSVSAAMCTMAFNHSFEKNVFSNCDDSFIKSPYWNKATNSIKQGYFDSRVFNLPKEEVNNCLLWRQRDAENNSILSVAQYYFTHGELRGVSRKQLQNKLLTEKNANWNSYPTYLKRGVCCIKQSSYEHGVIRNKWVIDYEIPIFSQDTNYVNSRIIFDNEMT